MGFHKATSHNLQTSLEGREPPLPISHDGVTWSRQKNGSKNRCRTLSDENESCHQKRAGRFFVGENRVSGSGPKISFFVVQVAVVRKRMIS